MSFVPHASEVSSRATFMVVLRDSKSAEYHTTQRSGAWQVRLSSGARMRVFLQEAYPAKNAHVIGSHLAAKFWECRVPRRIVREQQSARTEEGKGGPIFPQHMIVAVQAIVNEDINRAQLC